MVFGCFQMIELAPAHKTGLSLQNPFMLASGFGGYGDLPRTLLDVEKLGGIITNPITLRPQAGMTQPRVVETTAGFIFNTGQQNPGVRHVIQRHQKLWARLNLPIIAHLPADEPDDLARTARALANLHTRQGASLLAGIELGVPQQALPSDLKVWLQALQTDCDLPLLVKLPLGYSLEFIEVAETQAVDTLVIGVPHLASTGSLTGELVNGWMMGAGLFGLLLQELHLLYNQTQLPLVATGGIHTLAEAETLLSAGALAVQIDSLVFREPQVVMGWCKS